jgi:hypothetical protein
MKRRRRPSNWWVAVTTGIAVLAVFAVLALRLRVGDDPALGASAAPTQTTTTQTTTTPSQSSSDDGSSSATPSSPSTSRAS